MTWMRRLGLLALLTASIAVMGSLAKEQDSQYTHTEVMLSRHLHLEPAEIRRWQTLQQARGSLQGFVAHDKLSVYEILALHTDDSKEVKRLAKLLAMHNIKVLDRLKRFERFYQQELEALQ